MEATRPARPMTLPSIRRSGPDPPHVPAELRGGRTRVRGSHAAPKPFVPPIDGPRPMDPALFAPSPLKLRERLLDVRIDDRLTYDDTTNTVFMNFAGMRVRSEADIQRIVASVDKLLAPLGHRVNAIVNYDGFRVDDDVMTAYRDAVKYVAERYYVNVTRYAHSGLMRHLLGSELSRRALDAHVYETEDEAQRRLGAAD